jgi:hypothetical protein
LPLPVTTRNAIRPACNVLPPTTWIPLLLTLTVTVGMLARALAPAGDPPTTATAPSDAAVTATAPTAIDLLNPILPPFPGYCLMAAA